MSESGFSGLPPGGRPRQSDVPLPQSIFMLKARIIEIRGEIKAPAARIKMEGEIIRNNPDGTTNIRTEKGELTVQLGGRDRPKEGTKVEIEIPAGDPAKQVILRALPQQPQSVTLQEARTNTNREEHLAPRTIERPAEQVPYKFPEIEVIPEKILSLTPLPPEQSEQIIRPVLELLQTKVTILPAQIQMLAERRLPPVFLEQIAQKNAPRLILVPFPEDAPPTMNSLPNAAPVPQTIQENAPSLLTTPVLIIAPPEEEPITQSGRPLFPQQLNPPPPLLQTDVLPVTQSKTPFQMQASPKLQLFDIRIQTITPPQVILTSLPANTEKASISMPQQISHAIQKGYTGQQIFPAIQKGYTGQQIFPAIQKGYTGQQIFRAIQKGYAGQAGSITGTVTGVTPQNLPVISFFTPGLNIVQNFTMPFQAGTLLPGTEIEIVPQRGITASFQASAPAASSIFMPLEFFSSFQWPVMQDIENTLQQAAPQVAQTFVHNIANASAPARLPMLALFFIAAIRSGDTSSWLGDKTVDMLRRLGKGDLLSRLNRDISGLQKISTEPLSQDWRAIALPIMGGETLYKMMLYYRHDQENGENDKENKRGTRFIFDLKLNRLGDVQLDGLHRSAPSNQSGRLDLVVRTHRARSQPMQKNMRRTYINALGQTELTGELSFQNSPEKFIKIDMPKEDITVSA